MRVLFVPPECAPLTKTGGLGDVSAALPAALRALGHDVRILIPGYPAVLAACPAARRVLPLGSPGFDAAVLESDGFMVLDCAPLYRRDGGPYQDVSGADWPDNPLRFGLLSKAAALLARDWQADILHCNDWPTALAALFLHFESSRTASSIVTIHNLAFQGNFDAGWVQKLGLPPQCFTLEGAEFHGQLSFLKAGLAYADAITTVSPSYAREIQGAELGCGLDGLLRHRAAALTGILNGIDTDIWDPAKDRFIDFHYGSSSLEGKSLNKAALQKRLGLEPRADVPLLGGVSRLTHQKGTDLVAAAAEAMVALPAQLAVLGAGNRDHEEMLSDLKRKFPGKIGVQIGFDEALAHLVEAGADFFLMPARSEPGGLNQMYSQRYGTPPVARATGGLADTIADGETGFLFERAEAGALLAAARRAVTLWRDELRRLAMQPAGMARDFGWTRSARRYAELYARLAVDRPAAVP